MTKQTVTFPWPTWNEVVEFDAERPSDSVEGWYNRSYFCTQCGRIWAVWAAEGNERFFAVHRSCGTHSHPAYSSERPGSLLVNVREDLAMLPAELLVREFQLSDQLTEGNPA